MEEIQKLERNQPQAIVRGSSEAFQEQGIVDVSPQDAPHLLDYWNVILKRRWVVLATLLIVFTTVAIGTLKEKPIYRGTVLLEITPEEPNVLNFQQFLRIDTQDPDTYKETQYKVIQSRTLAERVVQDLQLYKYPEFYRGRHLFGFMTENPKHLPSVSSNSTLDPSSQVYRNSVQNFQSSVDISPVRQSNLVQVMFDSYDPQRAAQVANRLASDYIDQNLQVKWDETVKASEWLSSQLVGLKAKLEKSEDALQAYAQANSILFVTEKKNLVNARLEQLQEEYTKAQADRFAKESKYKLVKTGRVQDLPGFLSNKLIQDLSENLADLQRDYAQLLTKVKPDYPTAVALHKQISTVQSNLDHQKEALAQNIVDEYRSSLENEKYLGQALQEQKKEVNEIAQKSIQYNILKREVDTNKQLYDGLLQRLKQAQVSAGLKASNIRVVDPAQVPESPVKPRVILNLALGIFLGTGLGIGLAFFQEYLDNTLKTPEEVEQMVRLPSLGVLPRFAMNGTSKSLETGFVSPQETTALSRRGTGDPVVLEAFRSLRTSILLSAPPVPKSILVTSALPGEGKSTTAFNLGVTLASLHSRVLIIDCDLRRPTCHRLAGVRNQPGFVQCLTGHVEASEALLPVDGIPNLSVIPCGPIPPNPAEILSSPVAADLIRKLRDRFDYVLVDSPPLLTVSDSRILCTLTDAVVLVTRAYRTPFTAVRRARTLLYNSGARILGVALNDLDIRKNGYGHYDQYGYGYGYGYKSANGDGEYDSKT